MWMQFIYKHEHVHSFCDTDVIFTYLFPKCDMVAERVNHKTNYAIISVFVFTVSVIDW